MRKKKSSNQLPVSHSQKLACGFYMGIGGGACLERCLERLWLIARPLAVGWERVIMPALLLFYHRYFMAQHHQVTNVLIIAFLSRTSSACPLPSWFWPMVLPYSSSWTAVTFAIKELFSGSHAERDMVISPAMCRLQPQGSWLIPFPLLLPITLWVKCCSEPETPLASLITENGTPGWAISL